MQRVEAAPGPAPVLNRRVYFDRLYWAILLGVPAVLALLPIGSAFWLDETGSYWLIRGGFADIARRCTVLPQSMLYTALLWGIDQIAGHSEIVFRVPSALAIIAAVYLLYRLAREEFGREAALAAAALFASAPLAMGAARDARPYALGALCVVAASLLVLRWMRTGRFAYGLAFAAAAALAIHFHFFFAPVLGAHALYLLLVARRRQIRAAHAAAVVLCFGALVAPLGPQFIQLAGTSVARTYVETPAVMDLVWRLIPVSVVIPAVCVLIVTIADRFWKGRPPQRRTSRSVLTFVLAWAFLSPAILWVLSVSTPTHIFISRYLLCAAPGLALLWAVVLSAPRPLVLRRAFLAVAVATSLLGSNSTQWLFDHSRERGDWRAALAFIERQTAADAAPVLLRSGFIESDLMNWRAARVDRDVMYAPAGYYPAKANFVPLPLTMSPEAGAYLAEFASSARTRGKRFFLMGHWGIRPLPPFLDVLRSSLPGWRETRVADFNGIHVYEFRPQ